MKKEKILNKVIFSNKNIQFAEFIRLVEGFGFKLDRINGSHHIFKHPDIVELINIQNVKGKVKPYQINQFLSIIEKYDLKLENKE
ncbi:MAG: type II toxin-antitoxin system HicA family toxin [Candidatus Zixiibacteriota bacterium]